MSEVAVSLMNQTKFNIPLVEQVLINLVLANTTDSQIDCFVQTYDMDEFQGLSVVAYAFDHSVNLKLMLDNEVLSACQVNSSLYQLLHCCPLLQVLPVSGELGGAVNIVVDAARCFAVSACCWWLYVLAC